MADLPGVHPGCMIASICYQERLFDREVIELNRRAMESMNERFRRHLRAIAEVYPPREPLDLDVLAEMVSCIVDGGIIMAKVLNDPSRLVQQVLAYRSLVKLQFSPAVAAARPVPAAVAAA